MKNSLLLLFAFFSPALFAQVMTVTVDQDDFLVCPDEVVEVVRAVQRPIIPYSLTVHPIIWRFQITQRLILVPPVLQSNSGFW